MYQKGLFMQNVIALVWDFDKTLSPHYMQAPLFDQYNIDADAFWDEVNALPRYYARADIRVQRDTCYLGHLLSYVQHGKLPGLTNAKLRELGARIEFYPGIPDLLCRLAALAGAPEYEDLDLRLENYVVSTGLAEMVRGSAIAPNLDDIWGCEFIETAAGPGTDLSGAPKPGAISQIASLLDNTTKTRALFEINKGVNKLAEISVNDTIPEDERRVPFKNMIYIADGPSDIPSFSVLKHNGGLAYAVYDPANTDSFTQAVNLLDAGRVDAYGVTDYRPGSSTEMWLTLKVRAIAERIRAERKDSLISRVGRGPTHIKEHDQT
jgi:hypothetical protein